MNYRVWLCAAAVLAVVAGPVAAQDQPTSMSFEEANRYADLRNGTKRLVREPNAAEAKKNEDVIKKKAQVEMHRFRRAVSGGEGVESLPQFIRSFSNSSVIDLTGSPRKLTEGQRDLIDIFGKEMVDQLQKIIGTKEKPSGADMLTKINAARMLSVVGRSGYTGVATAATEIITNPQQHDAVKHYALEALNNLFSVPNAEFPQYSIFGRDKDKVAIEEKAILALIEFIARKPDIKPDTPEEEINALRFIRRSAVRALGKVRKPVLRDQNEKIVAVPALWLLRVANQDRNIVPSPSLTERVDALVGYLYLNPDKQQHMDFSAGFVATAIRDLTLEYQNSKVLEKVKADEKPPQGLEPHERDYHPWKLTANRIQVGLKHWFDNWNDPALGARPAETRTMMESMIDVANRNILNYMVEGNQKASISLQGLDLWLRNTKFPNRTLYPGDDDGFIVRPEAR